MHVGTIIVADENKQSRTAVRAALPDKYFIVIEAANSERLLDIIKTHPVDVMIISTTLACVKQASLIREIRQTTPNPVLVIGPPEDSIECLENGADDYICPPFKADEVLARINTSLRRMKKIKDSDKPLSNCPKKATQLKFGPWRINRIEFIIHDDKHNLCPLTLQEYNLLNLLIANSERPLSRDHICAEMKKHNAALTPRAVDIKISRIRKKIDPTDAQHSFIQTVRGVGYRFIAPIEIIHG